MKLGNVRRLTGVSLNLDRPGAVGELAGIPEVGAGPALSLWRKHARRLLDAVGWGDAAVAIRPYAGGASLAVSAPVDGLFAATEVIEAAWRLTTGGDFAAEIAALREEIAREASPAMIALAAAAEAHGVTLLAGEDLVSLGFGVRGQCWPESAPPTPEDVDWGRIGDVPLAMVTGTNGKSTSVRLTAAIMAASGKVVGQSSSDWVRVGGEILDWGDYSGPAGAMLAVRDPRVEVAVLEAARGGLMRRGLPVPRADVCLVTNVAADHLGDYGIVDVPTLAEAKLLIVKALRPGGRLVLNADDAELSRLGAGRAENVAWFSLNPDDDLRAWVAAGGAAAWLDGDRLMLARNGVAVPVTDVGDFPLALGGAARFNIANALGAICVADALGAPVEAMRAGLAGFSGSPDENPGRGNFMEIGGLTVVVDFAHNPHGISALLGALRTLPARRISVQIGQAGDRSDADILELTRVVRAAGADHFVIKEIESKLRGRAPGVVPTLIEAELRRLGVGGDAIIRAADEVEATRRALEWADADDMLVLLIYEDRDEVMALLDGLVARGWRPGEAIDFQAVIPASES